jgi:16S rRNA G527 N7-methylase RsmG
VTARAVAHVDILIPWMLQVVKKWGKLVLYKEYKEEEKKVLDRLCKKNTLIIKKEHHYVLFDGDIQRVINIIDVWFLDRVKMTSTIAATYIK